MTADTLDDFEATLSQLVLDAMTTWATRAVELALPTITADALPPDPAAGRNADGDWEDAFNQLVLPALAALMAQRIIDELDARGARETVAAFESAGKALPDSVTVPYPKSWLLNLDDAERAQLVTTWTQLADAAKKTTISDGARAVLAGDEWSQHIEQYLASVSNRVVGMPDTIFARVSKELSDGIIAHESPMQLRDRVHTILTATGHDTLVNNRAMLIARTEATGAYNAASKFAAQIDFDDEPFDKVWVATVDGRTRDSHFAVDGQRVDSDSSFTLAGGQLDYPGDPNGPVEEIANCRCTVLFLAKDEALPGEQDRQTEIDGESRHRDGTQADEIARRRRDGVTRAREDDVGVGMVAAAEKEKTMRRTFNGVLAPIGKPTGDGRVIHAEAAVAFREFPLPLMFQKQTNEGHDKSVIVGRIDEAAAVDGEITCSGVLFESAEAEEAATLLDEKVIRPSVDLCDMVAEHVLLDADGNELTISEEGELSGEPAAELMVVKEATVMAATLVAKPAFAEAKIELGDALDADADKGENAESLVAAAGLLDDVVDAAVFDVKLEKPTPLTVTEDGRVFGHLATWGTCHVGMQDRCVTPPRTASNYAHFHTSTIPSSDGPVAVGRLTVGCGHAGARSRAAAAAEHYDTVGTCWAFVRAYEDEFGIAVAGVVNPLAEQDTITAGASAPLSGDWRNIGGQLELVAALSVNTPGFPVPRSFSNDKGAEMSLVAAGAIPASDELDTEFLDKIVASAVSEYISRMEADKRARRAYEIKQRASQLAVQSRARRAAQIAARINSRKAGV